MKRQIVHVVPHTLVQMAKILVSRAHLVTTVLVVLPQANVHTTTSVWLVYQLRLRAGLVESPSMEVMKRPTVHAQLDSLVLMDNTPVRHVLQVDIA
jgi:hypothetical protein